MQLQATRLLERLSSSLKRDRAALKTVPGLALVWVGRDPATASFVKAKQLKARELECAFTVHHFPRATAAQLIALIRSLNQKKSVHGIVLQLPLPKTIAAPQLIELITPVKDIDNLRGDSPYPSPTPTGILALLSHHRIRPSERRSAIMGSGRLVGAPLVKLFEEKNWPYTQIRRDAKRRAKLIHRHDILIAATGVAKIVAPAMVHRKMVVIDGSGVDVDVPVIEPLVAAVTPTRGGIGPLTVGFLFANLLEAAKEISEPNS